MRYGFITCVEIGRSCIDEILDAGGHIDLLMTLRDDLATRKSGRVYLDSLADEHQIPLVKIGNVNDAEAIRALRDADLDWVFLIGWSQIAREEFLSVPHRGVLGAHPTLLPEGRGRAAVPWAILKGLERTGVTLFVLDEGVDTGPIISQVEIPLTNTATATSLYEEVNGAHRSLIRQALPLLEDDTLVPTPQDDEQASEWPGRRPEDGEIRSTMTLDEVDRLVRAVTRPYPGAWCTTPTGEVLTVWSGRPLTSDGEVSGRAIQCADGIFDATETELSTG